MLNISKCEIRKCKWFMGINNKTSDTSDYNELEDVYVCEAFPNGIPEDIAYGDNEHNKPVEGDNGIQYEKGE